MKIKSRPYQIDGKTVYLSGNNEQELAENYSMLVLKSIQEKEVGTRTVAKVVQTDFCEYAEKWLEHKINRSKITAGTAIGYRGHLKQIMDYFKGMLLEKISRDMIQAFLDLYQHQSQSTIKKKRIILQQIFKWGVEDNLISENPAVGDRIEINGKAKVKRPAVPEELYLKIMANLKSIKRRDDRALLALTACTGMRRGEALALRWEDINWERSLIRIDKAVSLVGNQPQLKGPKSEKGNRTVPMIPQLLEVLKPMAHLTGYIVSIDGEKPFSDTMVQNSLNRIQEQAGMQGYTFHCLRHAFATMMAKNASISAKTLQTMMGHADISTTYNMYAETENNTIAEAGYLFSQQLTQ